MFDKIEVRTNCVYVDVVIRGNRYRLQLNSKEAMELGGRLHQAGIEAGHYHSPNPTSPKTAA